MVDVSIIIVSWNVRALLEKCLRSIEQTQGTLRLEVFAVDNASTDGTAAWLKTFHASGFTFHAVANATNRGFAAANNQAIKQATGEYVLLLNPDTELQAAALQHMLTFMHSHPRCGVLGPKLLNIDGSLQRSVRRFPDVWSPTLMSLGITPKRYLALDLDFSHSQIVDQVMGACLLTRRSVIDRIGTLDERFFIWFEEVDFCRRTKNAGWEVWYSADAEVMHHGGQSFAQTMTFKKQWWFSRSLLYYFWKHKQFGAFIVNLIFIPLRLLIAVFVRL